MFAFCFVTLRVCVCVSVCVCGGGYVHPCICSRSRSRSRKFTLSRTVHTYASTCMHAWSCCQNPMSHRSLHTITISNWLKAWALVYLSSSILDKNISPQTCLYELISTKQKGACLGQAPSGPKKQNLKTQKSARKIRIFQKSEGKFGTLLKREKKQMKATFQGRPLVLLRAALDKVLHLHQLYL